MSKLLRAIKEREDIYDHHLKVKQELKQLVPSNIGNDECDFSDNN